MSPAGSDKTSCYVCFTSSKLIWQKCQRLGMGTHRLCPFLLLGPFMLLFPFHPWFPSEPTAFCLLHHPLWWWLASDRWNEDSSLEPTSVFPLSAGGASPTKPEPPAKADPKDEMSACSKRDLLTMQMESSCTCPVDKTKEGTLMNQIWEATEPPPTQGNVQTLWSLWQYAGAVSYLYITCLWKWGCNIFHCFLSNRKEKSSKLS